jgi:hypothetical protein
MITIVTRDVQWCEKDVKRGGQVSRGKVHSFKEENEASSESISLGS